MIKVGDIYSFEDRIVQVMHFEVGDTVVLVSVLPESFYKYTVKLDIADFLSTAIKQVDTSDLDEILKVIK